MGIYDRDYYRKEGPSILGTWAATGQATMWLVVCYFIIYVIQLVTATDGIITGWLAMGANQVFHQGEVWRLLTGIFVHNPNNPWQIIWNMLFLWFFGRDIEAVYGRWEYLAYFIVAGLVGNILIGVTGIWAHPFDVSLVPGLSAGGAVTAVMILCAFHFPTKTILIMLVLPVPLWLFAVGKVALDLLYFLHGFQLPVALAAEVGCAVYALLYYKLNARFVQGGRSLLSLMRRSQRPALRVYREEPVLTTTKRGADVIDEQLEAKTDAVLEKISQKGPDSLTAEEREILARASEKYRRRRS